MTIAVVAHASATWPSIASAISFKGMPSSKAGKYGTIASTLAIAAQVAAHDKTHCQRGSGRVNVSCGAPLENSCPSTPAAKTSASMPPWGEPWISRGSSLMKSAIS